VNVVEPTVSCPDPQRWIALVTKNAVEDDAGCWVWQKKLNRYGYGMVSILTADGQRRGTGAHRAAWIAFRGDIPEVNLHIDHLCRNRACVNPWHMDLVTNRVNTQRGWDVRPPEKRPRVVVKDRVKPGCKKHGRQEGRVNVDERGHHFKCYICQRERSAAARAARSTTKVHA
jgi:hypothetical protein